MAYQSSTAQRCFRPRVIACLAARLAVSEWALGLYERESLNVGAERVQTCPNMSKPVEGEYSTGVLSQRLPQVHSFTTKEAAHSLPK